MRSSGGPPPEAAPVTRRVIVQATIVCGGARPTNRRRGSAGFAVGSRAWAMGHRPSRLGARPSLDAVPRSGRMGLGRSENRSPSDGARGGARAVSNACDREEGGCTVWRYRVRAHSSPQNAPRVPPSKTATYIEASSSKVLSRAAVRVLPIACTLAPGLSGPEHKNRAKTATSDGCFGTERTSESTGIYQNDRESAALRGPDVAGQTTVLSCISQNHSGDGVWYSYYKWIDGTRAAFDDYYIACLSCVHLCF